jgi:hypothetical protein
MFDLMSITKSGLYVDSRFEGSNSIKKVLPVMVPELSYKDQAIQQGVAASTSWDMLTNPKTPKKKREQLKKDMLAYCERDTIAMVEIYKKFLEAIR